MGSEFVLALDIRFASREKAILSQREIGAGIIPGDDGDGDGDGLERLPLLTGRARALEIAIGADDFDADTAERYGWINRAVPDAELDQFVERFATRVASFDRQAIAEIKGILNQRGGLPAAAGLASTGRRFTETLTWPAARARIAKLLRRGFQQRGDLELRLGDHLAAE